MSRLHHKKANNMKQRTCISILNPISPVEVYANENDLRYPQDTELDRTIINFI